LAKIAENCDHNIDPQIDNFLSKLFTKMTTLATAEIQATPPIGRSGDWYSWRRAGSSLCCRVIRLITDFQLISLVLETEARPGNGKEEYNEDKGGGAAALCSNGGLCSNTLRLF
jgi:hypothetical protein